MPNPFQSQENNSSETQELSDFANGFLKDVDESDREIVSKYIKQWDGGVTRKFQEYSGKLKGYEELGDLDTLVNAQGLVQDIQNDPVQFFNYFRDYLLENAQAIQEQYGIDDLQKALGMAQQMSNNELDDSGLPEYDGIPKEFVQQFQEMQSKLESFGSEYEQMKASQQEREQMEMLDNVLSDLHNEHGDFDDRVVLSLIASGLAPEEAIQEWNGIRESIVSSQGSNAPVLLNGPAATPLDQVDMDKLKDPAARKQIGAALLSSLNQR